jgi:hypothetical protein
MPRKHSRLTQSNKLTCNASKMAANALWSAFSRFLIASSGQGGNCHCELCVQLLTLMRQAEDLLRKYQKAIGQEPIYFNLPDIDQN